MLSNSFDEYRCDKKISLGLNLQNLQKILKCAKKGDSVALKAEDEGDSINITFDSEGERTRAIHTWLSATFLV